MKLYFHFLSIYSFIHFFFFHTNRRFGLRCRKNRTRTLAIKKRKRVRRVHGNKETFREWNKATEKSKRWGLKTFCFFFWSEQCSKRAPTYRYTLIQAISKKDFSRCIMSVSQRCIAVLFKSKQSFIGVLLIDR